MMMAADVKHAGRSFLSPQGLTKLATPAQRGSIVLPAGKRGVASVLSAVVRLQLRRKGP